MDRREFLRASAAALALSALNRHAAGFAREPAKRVGLIGCGWYGKCDLFRLLQVAPVEVVSLCDVDKRMLGEAAELTAARQRSRKKPRLHGDYREMLKEKDLDIVLIATPDHWHALPTIAAVEAGADVYVQKPVSVDVIEGQAMLAAARRHKRVVQVGTQRRSTPHLIEARDRIIREGKLGRIGLVEIFCYYHMRAGGNPPDTDPPAYLDYEMWTGPAPMRPYNELVHPRTWRAFMEYSNGVVGDMCVHMFDMVRWMLGLGWPARIASSGGILVEKQSKANISDTQTATFDYGDLNVVWQHRTWGRRARPEMPLGRNLLRRERHAEGQRFWLRLHSRQRPGKTGSSRRGLRIRAIPRRPDGKRPGAARRAGHPPAHAGLAGGDCPARPARGRHRRGPYLHGQLHFGECRHAARPNFDLGRQAAARCGRRRGQRPLAAAVSPAVGPSPTGGIVRAC